VYGRTPLQRVAIRRVPAEQSTQRVPWLARALACATEKLSIIFACDMPARLTTLPPTSAPQSVVLDTNAVLDCWLFDDARARGLRAGIEQGRLHWYVTDAMLVELGTVMQRSLHPRWEMSRERILRCNAWHHWKLKAGPEAPRPPPGLRCTDSEDQKFLDLALHLRARWLVTRDRALLRLSREAARHGVTILPPQRWRHD